MVLLICEPNRAAIRLTIHLARNAGVKQAGSL